MTVVAIDGPSGSGKSSVSRALAQAFNWQYLDTGALYRAVTLLDLKTESAEIEDLLEALTSKAVELIWVGNPEDPCVLLNGENVNMSIRSQEVTDRVSEIAANPDVRKFLLGVQREIINKAVHGIVVEGRDIGTTVWPDAELKIFLTADLTARAARRSAELAQANNADDVGLSLAKRDAIDSTRSTSPLRQIEDQVVVDATHLTLEEVVAKITTKINELRLMDGSANHE